MFNIRFATDYLLHRLTANTRHGTHSPFVYRLVDKVIYDFSDQKVYQQIQSNRKRPDTDNIDTSKTSTSIRLLKMIYRLAADLQPQNLIVLGNDAKTVEPWLQASVPTAHILTHSTGIAENKLSKRADLVYIGSDLADGNILKHFESILPNAHEDSLMIIKDIYRTKASKQAWAQIKANPKVTVTIDLFWMGLVYFRKGQRKEDFKIKF